MDIASYRLAETLARRALPSWRAAEAQRPIWFERVGFPCRVESTAELAQLVDTMQEGRFEAYQAELGGLSDADVADLVDALENFARFYGAMFHAARVPVPLDTMTAHLALKRKIRGYLGRQGAVLELGPGCGYLSFFTGDWDARYEQIENTESFYLLQHLVNAWCYGFGLRERAVPPTPGAVDGIDLPWSSYRCAHHPWWALDGVQGPFDVITSNANLTEMAHDAMVRYVALMQRTIAPQGALIVQCSGADVGGWNKRVLPALAAAGFAPLVHVPQGPVEGCPEKSFPVNNALFLPATHEAYGRASWGRNQFDPADPIVRRTYFPADDAPRRLYGADEITARVREALAA